MFEAYLMSEADLAERDCRGEAVTELRKIGMQQAAMSVAVEVLLEERDALRAELARVRTQVAADLLPVIQRMTPVIDAAIGLRGAETDDEICEAWATFDQAVDDYREQLEAAGPPSGTVGTDNQESGS